MNTPTLWITIPNWERFQHYGQARRPIWIKNYTALLHKDEYVDLSYGQRGLLHGIWLAYAELRGRLAVERLTAELRQRARKDSLDALNHAGFIDVVASKPLLLDLNPSYTRAREESAERARRHRAETWIRNGAAREVPPSRLAEVLTDEFKLGDDAELVEQLVAIAQEYR